MRKALEALCDAYAACNGEDHPAYRTARRALIMEDAAKDENKVTLLARIAELEAEVERLKQELDAFKACHGIGKPHEGYREAVWREALVGAGGQAVAVKPLEWHDKSIPIMRYFAECDEDGKWRYSVSGAKMAGPYALKRYSVHCGEYPTIEAAKAAAQADYERRILSALEPAADHIADAGKMAEPVQIAIISAGNLDSEQFISVRSDPSPFELAARLEAAARLIRMKGGTDG